MGHTGHGPYGSSNGADMENRLQLELDEAQSHAYNLTPYRTEDDWENCAVSQIQKLYDQLNLNIAEARVAATWLLCRLTDEKSRQFALETWPWLTQEYGVPNDK